MNKSRIFSHPPQNNFQLLSRLLQNEISTLDKVEEEEEEKKIWKPVLILFSLLKARIETM